MVIALREIIDGKASAYFLDSMARFTCRDKDVEIFLKTKAVDFERRDKSRTYLILDAEGANLLGYFTLSLNALPFRETVD